MTEKQKRVYDFIQAFIKTHGFAPSYTEIAKGLELRSKSNIHRLVHSLKDKGLIKINAHMVRSIKVIDNTVREMAAL
jgi:repressor LexA